jgi:hypothetical protein
MVHRFMGCGTCAPLNLCSLEPGSVYRPNVMLVRVTASARTITL